MANTGSAIKRLILGRPMTSGELEHTLLPKVIALPVFSSDPLSSNAYATQEILLVLGAAGAASLSLVLPISLAVALLLATVVTSYRQTVRAYPSGGGAYRVSRENLGMSAGLAAAAALLIDYVLTVSVSITAGVDAILSAVPSLEPQKIPLAMGFIAFVTLMNLRGVRESGTLFAIPTYGFVASIYLLIVTGFVKCLGGCPVAESAGAHLEATQGLTILLILKAFAAGTTALTGVEAIADGVQAFRYPQSRNAAATLAIMGVLATSMFLGISWLADQTNVVHTHHSEVTVVAEIARAVFGGGFLFYLLQVMTAAILILAANTAYQDFPRLSSILAQDRFMPRQLMNRGDRLVFSNGIVVLAVMAALLIVVFDAELNRLIQLYLVGVFVSFTLSQAGMTLRWRRLRDKGWRHRAAINGFGATVTGTVLCVVIATKFSGGAWIVVLASPLLMLTMRGIYRHYTSVEQELDVPERRPPDQRPGHQRMVVLVNRIDTATARAVGYVRSVRPAEASAITFDRSIAAVWSRLAPEIPLQVIDQQGGRADTVKRHLRGLREGLSSHEFLTFVMPELLKRSGLREIIRRPTLHRLKAALLGEPGIQVLDIPIMTSEVTTDVDQAREPVRNYVCVLVSRVHNATLQAIEYAETFRPTDLRAVSIGLDPQDSERLAKEWLEAGIQHPLEIEDSPFRDIGESLVRYVRQFNPDGINTVVTVVLPEFIVKKRRHQLLHGQTALLVKRRMLFEPGVVVASVPYPLEH